MGPAQRSTLILSVSHDPELLSTRHLLLQSDGHMVESISSIEVAMKALHDGDSDLLLFCHSLSQEEQIRMTRRIRDEGSSIPIIIMAAEPAPDPNWPDGRRSGSTPRELLDNVTVALRHDRFRAPRIERMEELRKSAQEMGTRAVEMIEQAIQIRRENVQIREDVKVRPAKLF